MGKKGEGSIVQKISVAFGAVAVVGLLLAVCFFPMIDANESSADGNSSMDGYYATLDLSEQKDTYMFVMGYEAFPQGRGVATIGIKGITAEATFVLDNSCIKSLTYNSASDAGDYKAFTLKGYASSEDGKKENYLNQTCSISVVDGNKTYSVNVFLSDGSVPVPGTDPEPVVCDYVVSGTPSNPDVWVPHTFNSNNNSNDFSIKYSNTLIDSAKSYTVSDVKVLVEGREVGMSSATVRSPVSGADYVVIDFNGWVSYSDSNGRSYPLEISVMLVSGESAVEFSVFLGNNKYWNEMDTTSAVKPTMRLFFNENARFENTELIMLNGISSVSAIQYNIPGITITCDEDGSQSNGGLSLLRVVADWNNVINNIYEVTVVSGSTSYSFDLYVNKCSVQPSTAYDYDFVGVTTTDHGRIDWNIGEKDSLTIRAQIPSMTSGMSITGMLMIGTDVRALSEFIDYEIVDSNVEEKYVVFTLYNKSLSIPSDNYRITLTQGNTGAGGTIDLNVIVEYDNITTIDNEGRCTISDWNITDVDTLRVRINGLSERSQDIRVMPEVYKDGQRVSDYSSLFSLYSVYFSEGYILVSVDQADALSEGSYKFVFKDYNNTFNYELSFDVVETSNTPDGADYSLTCVASQNGANTRLTTSIQKNNSALDLSDAKLLVIAKYQGGIVVNFYTSPSIVNGVGSDVIEVSTLNLREVIIEIVNGFQQGNPEYFGYCSYTVS